MGKNGSSEASRIGISNPRRAVFILMTAAMLLAAFPPVAMGRVNLPQISKHIVMSEPDHAALKKYFASRRGDTKDILSEDSERILLDMLPEEFRAGCQEMILQWGTVAEGTERFSVRVLFTTDAEKRDKKQVLLIYRCFSAYAGYRDEFYDERLAVLFIDPDKSSLVLVPHAGNCASCSDLSHIRFDQVLQCAATPLVSLLIATSNNNPCCDGPFRSNEERINYYVLQDSEVKLAASVLRHREESEHDDLNGDMTTIYDAKISEHRDRDGNVTHIGSRYSRSENGELRQTGELTYVWNQEKKEFDWIEK